MTPDEVVALVRERDELREVVRQYRARLGALVETTCGACRRWEVEAMFEVERERRGES